MTKKHFEAIAAIIRSKFDEVDSQEPAAAGFDEGHDAGYLNASTEIAGLLADYFVTVNPNFNRDKFLKACGL